VLLSVCVLLRSRAVDWVSSSMIWSVKAKCRRLHMHARGSYRHASWAVNQNILQVRGVVLISSC
jgi:hypothetical protein